jgi:hypothetical protein
MVASTRRARQLEVFTSSLVIAALLCSCGSGGDAGNQRANKMAAGLVDASAPAPSVEPEEPSSTSTSTTTTSIPATTPTTGAPAPVAPAPPATVPEVVTVPPDPADVDSCVSYVQLTTLLGDPAGREIWERSGSTDDGLRSECTHVVAVDPAAALAMRSELDAINASLEAAATTTTTTTTPPPPPPPPPPPTAAPRVVPAVDLGACDPNYSGCVPVASDVDCAGGSGNGPAYVRGPVSVIGRDIYDLDGNDNDGIGCES